MATLMSLAREVDADVSVMGWGQPPHLWEVHGTWQDPYLVLSAVGHDVELPSPLDLPNGAIGVAFCAEAYRHLDYEEMLTLRGEWLPADLAATAPSDALRAAWQRFTTVTPVDLLRPEARRESRYVVLVVGPEMVFLRHDRDGEVQVRAEGPVRQVAHGAIMEMMTLASPPE